MKETAVSNPPGSRNPGSEYKNAPEFAVDTEVMVQFPLTTEESLLPRENWTWFPGTVETVISANEVEVCIDDPRLNYTEDGEEFSPLVFRGPSELRLPDAEAQ